MWDNDGWVNPVLEHEHGDPKSTCQSVHEGSVDPFHISLHPLHVAWEVFACHSMIQTRDSHALPQFGLSVLPQPFYCCSASLCHLLPWRASSQGLQPANLCGCALLVLPSLEQGEQTDDKCVDAAIAISGGGGFIHHHRVYC